MNNQWLWIGKETDNIKHHLRLSTGHYKQRFGTAASGTDAHPSLASARFSRTQGAGSEASGVQVGVQLWCLPESLKVLH